MNTQTIGNQDLSWTLSGAFRGNLYTAQRAAALASFEMYLAPRAVCELRFVVCSAPAGDKRFTLEWTTTRKAKPEARFYSSGPTEVSIRPGRWYGVGVGWSGSCQFFSGAYGTFDGADAGVGVLAGSLFDNAYGAAPGGVPRNVGPTPSACYHQHVSTRP